ncbi:TPA: hypothetical protein I8196_003122 [Citrobacter freundii]|uniref:hypothetical protein n=1 Tax=Citrobacter freundii TaxID=546 RepID=UPI0015770E6C|nr:hypothetical protein [Citrobacter freundii]EKQ7212203.1 hypothetical protein [Citrobacter freundii]ELF4154242.1 hypothetical protein [Citrobacter freundii]MBJ8854630.1 hypothetical protein [Citrobacter freundii]NTY43953.1 hypothetical protein [Citrobacter freundii]NUN57194.1 hypothetical protein [Citrobacter freundii]
MNNKQRTERLTDEELEDLICELEAAGFYRRQLIGLAELQERRKADCTEPVAWLHTDNGIGIPAITRSRNVANSWLSKGWKIQPLYTFATQSTPLVKGGDDAV